MYDENPYQDQEYSQRPPRNPMATAAFSLGIASVFCCTFFYIALPCGALAVLCAILSRGYAPMQKKCRIAIILGVIGMAVSIVTTATTLHSVLTNPQMRSYVEQYLQMYTGDSGITLDQLFPFIAPAGVPAEETETESESDNRVHLRTGSGKTSETESELSISETIPDSKTPDTETPDTPPPDTQTSDTEVTQSETDPVKESPSDKNSPGESSVEGGVLI